MATIISPPRLAELFHEFPHLDFNFHNTTTVFTPDNVPYQQALLFNGVYLLFVTLILFLIFGIYFLVASCYFCGNCSPYSLAPRPSRSRCLRLLITFFGVFSGFALGFAFYGNSKAKDGVKVFADSVIHVYEQFDLYMFTNNEVISTYVDQASSQITLLEKKLGIINITSLTNVTTLLSNVHRDLKWSGNLLDAVGIDLKTYGNDCLGYDDIRWWITIIVLCFHLLLILVILYATCTNRKCAFIVLTVMAILSLSFMMFTVSSSVPLSIAAADICKNPKKAYLQYLTERPARELVTYYLECYNKSKNLLLKPYEDAKTDLETIQLILDNAIKLFPIINSLEETKVLLGAIGNSTKDLEHLIQMIGCQYVHKEYKEALTAVCTTVLEGFSLLILSCLIISVFLISLLLCITPLWKAIVPLRPILKKYGVHLVTDSYQGPPGGGAGSESFHGSSSFDVSYKSIDDHVEDFENLPLISRRNAPQPSYRTVHNGYGSTEFLSVEEDDRRPTRSFSGQTTM